MEIVGTYNTSVPYDYSYRQVERKIGKCDCGRKVYLETHTNRCKCGQRYNLFGQKVNRSVL